MLVNWDDVIKIVDAQAEDESLWFDANYISEAFLQQALRRLHAAVEAAYKNEVSESGLSDYT